MKTIFKNVWVVTVNENMDVIPGGVVVVEDDKIAYVGTEVPADCSGARVIDGHNKKFIMPGLINGHTHLPMTLFRSSADDMELQTWLNKYMLPMEDHHTPASVECGATLALYEMARGGVTTVNDMYLNNRHLIPAFKKVPLRALLSRGLFGMAPDADAQLEDAIAFYHEYNGAMNGLIRVGLAPHAEYTNTAEFLRKVGEKGRELKCPLHIHLSETKLEHEECIQRHGATPAGLLDRVGFFDDNLVLLAHCVWVTDEDIDIFAKKNVSVLHSTCSNLKLGSGIAPVPQMIEKGVNLTFSTDGAGSNNNLDMWEEMRIAALLHKGATHNAAVLPAEKALYIATRGGAKALGYEDVGSIVPGFQADLVLVDMENPCYHPMTNLIHHIVYAGNSRDVEMTMVAGNVVWEKGAELPFDVDALYDEAQDLFDNLFWPKVSK